MANEFIARNGIISKNNSTITGSLEVTQGITGSFLGNLNGTSSWSEQSVSGSYSLTSSYSQASTSASYAVSSSYSNNSNSASYSANNLSSSYALSSSYSLTSTSASYSENATSASYSLTNLSSSYALSSTSASYSDNATSASYALSSSFAISSLTAVTSSFAISSSFVTASNVFGPFGSNSILSSSFAVSSSRAVTSSFAISSSYALSASYAPSTPGFPYTGSAQITGSLGITGSLSVTQNITGSRVFLSGSSNTASGSILTVYGSGSTQPVLTVQGSQGELFSITDSLSGSLFSVNDISGLPILEVFSDGTTLLGNYQDPMLITTTKSVLTSSGPFTLYSIPTASYDTAFFEYSVRSGSNARAGQIMAIQSGSSVNYTETTTTNFGTTSGLALGVFISGSNMVLTGSASTTAWTIKSIIKAI